MRTAGRIAALAVWVAAASCAFADTRATGTELVAHAAVVAETLDRQVAPASVRARLRSVLVSQRGHLLVERYYNGAGPDKLHNVKSVSKSVLSALVGIAIDEGAITGLNATLAEYLGDLPPLHHDAVKAAITIEDLLTMRAGLRSTSNSGYGAWVTGDDWIDGALRQPLAAVPGRDMIYSTGSTHLLSAILARATERTMLEFGRERLSGPLGFELADWQRDPQGIHFGGNNMRLTPRQMLEFGELYLNGGRAGGRQIIPAAWVQASLARHAKSPHGQDRYYGYGWWVCRLAGFDVPHAWGHGGQFIMLVPDLDLVLVSTSAPDPDSANAHAKHVYRVLQGLIRSVAHSAPATLRASR